MLEELAAKVTGNASAFVFCDDEGYYLLSPGHNPTTTFLSTEYEGAEQLLHERAEEQAEA